jgi:hypothetical protein
MVSKPTSLSILMARMFNGGAAVFKQRAKNSHIDPSKKEGFD